MCLTESLNPPAEPKSTLSNQHCHPPIGIGGTKVQPIWSAELYASHPECSLAPPPVDCPCKQVTSGETRLIASAESCSFNPDLLRTSSPTFTGNKLCVFHPHTNTHTDTATQTTRHWRCPAALWLTCLPSSLVAMETSFRCFGLGFLLAHSVDALVPLLLLFVCLCLSVH